MLKLTRTVFALAVCLGTYSLQSSPFVVSFTDLLKRRNAEDTFTHEVINAQQPVVIKVFLPNCGPCNQIKQAFERLAQTYHGKVRFIEIDFNEFNDLVVNKLGASTVPTFFFYRNGDQVSNYTGSSPVKLRKALQEALRL